MQTMLEIRDLSAEVEGKNFEGLSLKINAGSACGDGAEREREARWQRCWQSRRSMMSL